MALDLAPSNFAGLAALASGGSGNLNLTVPGALGLQGLQLSQQQQESLRNAALAQAQLRQQGELGLRDAQIKRQELAQQGQYQQGLLGQTARGQDIQQQGQMMDADQNAAQLGFQQQQLAQQGALGQGQLDLEKQKLAQDQMAKEMAKLLDEKKENLQEKGSFVAYGLVAMKQAKTPEEAQMIRNEIISSAVSNEYITEGYAKALRKAPLSQFTNFLTQQVMTLDAVKNYKDMMDANAEKAAPSKLTSITRADGSVENYSDLTTPIKGQAQKDVTGADQNIKELEDMFNKVPSSFFGASALKQDATWYREWAQNAPLVGKMLKPDQKDKDQLNEYSSLQSQTKNQAMTIIKELSGLSYTDKQLEFMNEIVPNIGPGAVESEFKGKSKNLIRFFKQVAEEKRKILESGVKLGTPEYEDLMLKKMKTSASTINSPKYDEGLAEHFRKNGKTEEEINAYFKGVK